MKNSRENCLGQQVSRQERQKNEWKKKLPRDYWSTDSVNVRNP